MGTREDLERMDAYYADLDEDANGENPPEVVPPVKAYNELVKAAEDVLNALDDPNPKGMQLLNACDNLRSALDKVKP